VAQLGTRKRPAVVRVHTPEQAQEIVDFCNERGWQVVAGVEPDEPEDTSDLDRLLNRVERPVVVTPRLPPKISGNDYCPCRSGKKYKKCCGIPATGAS
jgi:SWIM/SEC-C metal-binding protein